MTDTTTAKPGETGGRDYSRTLFLPKTDFPMRAGLPDKEPDILARWDAIDLYRRLREASAGRPRYILHDGPPYANGHIHIGTGLNKILKDVVVRSMQMLGYDANYVPGWDCHGLPIEWKVEEELRAKGQSKDSVDKITLRRMCREFAEHWIKVQTEEFKRLGVVGDFAAPYTTMAFEAEAVIADELMKFAMSGQLYRGSKPVMWSVVEKTALAEAEVEYHDHESDTVWVKFPIDRDRVSFGPLVDGGPSRAKEALDQILEASVVIWTTTPWTIPGNRAVSYSGRIDYGLYEVTEETPLADGSRPWAKRGDCYLLADNVADAVFASARVPDGGWRMVRAVDADELAGLVCAHPLTGWHPTSPLAGEDVAPSTGSGRQEGGGAKPSDMGDAPPSALPGISPAKGEIGESRRPASSLGAAPPQGGRLAELRPYDFAVPLLEGEHVTDEEGTGFVHTAPGHGREDFEIWTERRRELEERGIDPAIPYTVDENGAFTADAPGFEGKRVIDDKGKKGDANQAVIDALKDAGMLIARGRLKHQYPHSWRSKKPVIFRNTPQWFVYMDKDLGGHPSAGAADSPPFALPGISPARGEIEEPHGRASAIGGDTLRSRALAAIDATRFVPKAGQNRLRGMIENRPDWVLSRQRAWGVPITVFRNVNAESDLHGELLPGAHPALAEASSRLRGRINAAFRAEGADAWFANGARERFLSGLVDDPGDWEMVTDILDVWFDSGSTHAFVLEKRDDLKVRRPFEGGPDTVLYLEGSDQHRGWFHSSLLESCGTRGRAPYDAVLTHGFVMAEDGRKMSKSLGNNVTPQQVIAQSGADILRLWTVSSDFTEDLRIGPEILKTNVDSYRKLRNTMRWMLGTLRHFRAEGRVAPSDMPELERLMLSELARLDPLVRQAYLDFDYKRIFSALFNFMTVDLSAFYFDVRKDALYCDPISSVTRRASLTVIDRLFDCLVKWLAPMLPFTMDEAWAERHGADSCVHLEHFPDVPTEWRDAALERKWAKVRALRRVVTGALEIERRDKRIGSSLEAAPVVHVSDPAILAALDGVDLAEIAITSQARLAEGEGPDDAFRLPEVAGVAVVPAKAEGRRCARSWKVLPDVGNDPDWPELSPRDAAAMREFEAASTSHEAAE